MMKPLTLGVVMVAAVSLGACGNSRLDRTVSGAGLGAASGFAIAAVAGGPIAGAVLVGGVAGGAIGAITEKHQLNLGKAWWEHKAG